MLGNYAHIFKKRFKIQIMLYYDLETLIEMSAIVNCQKNTLISI